MKLFLAEHGIAKGITVSPDLLSAQRVVEEDIQCEEVLLEAFGK
jgi:hypothetical protein